MRKFMTIAAAFALAVSACAIDARDEGNGDEHEHEGVTHTTDGGNVPTPGPTDPHAYVIAYTAPADFTGTPTIRTNASGGWDAVGATSGRTVTWTTRLDADRLTWSPCLATTTGGRCGYVLNVELPGYVPGFAVTQDGTAVLREVGTKSVNGPTCVRLDPVDNGLRGGNFWLHTCPTY